MENGGAVAEDETDDGADVNGARDRERDWIECIIHAGRI